MLRPFQSKFVNEIQGAWDNGARNVMGVSATGSGKTVCMGHVLNQLQAPACAVAHRQELVSQIALALNREQVPHGIYAPQAVQRQIIALEMETHGRSFYSPTAPVRVAGVDTLIKHDPKDRWFSQVQLAVMDEGHHVLAGNKWGEAMGMFPNTRGLFLTAHAIRADGKGLGREPEGDGLVDALVVGPSCRELIDKGLLTDYRLIAPPSHIDLSHVKIGSTGDYSAPQLRAAVHADGAIVGDVVENYLKFAPGKLGLTFAVDVEAATELAAAYRKAGVPAEVVTAKTPLYVRGQLMKQFKNRQILQLVNVDLFGEGTDVPALEVVSMARPTMSFQLYAQTFGRALRLMLSDDLNARWGSFTDQERLAYIAASAKPKALIIDHVANFRVHGLPDPKREYSLARRERREREGFDDSIPLRSCLVCLQPYPAVMTACEHCGAPHVPQSRGTPEAVEGDLFELDEASLKALRAAVNKIDNTARIPQDVSPIVAQAIKKNHLARQQAQADLRRAMALYGGYQAHLGRGEREGHKRFYQHFGIDVLSAQALGSPDAAALLAKIQDFFTKHNIVEATPNDVAA